jgi:hypothetical protein
MHLSIAYQILLRLVSLRPVLVTEEMVRIVLAQIGAPLIAEREAITAFVVACARADFGIEKLLDLLPGALLIWQDSANHAFAVHCALATFAALVRTYGVWSNKFAETVLLPSAASQDFDVFQQPFTDAVALAKNPLFATRAARVVVRGWSQAIAAKQVACLRALAALLPLARPQLTLSRKIGSLIATGIASPVSKVAIAALECARALGDLLDPELMVILLPAANEAVGNHWDPDVRKRVELAFDESLRCQLDTDDQDDWARDWIAIAASAAEADSSAEMSERVRPVLEVGRRAEER